MQVIKNFEELFPCSKKLSAHDDNDARVNPKSFTEIIYFLNENSARFSNLDKALEQLNGDYSYLPVLMQLEYKFQNKKKDNLNFPKPSKKYILNPGLEIFTISWSGLADFFTFCVEGASSADKLSSTDIHEGSEYLLLWKNGQEEVRIKKAQEADLLILKIIEEDMDPLQLWRESGINPAVLDQLLDNAVAEEMILRGESKLVRDWQNVPAVKNYSREVLVSEDFTIQWHITHTCDLHCKHCYDRTLLSNVNMDQANRILDQLYYFCREMNIDGHVVLSGGNPYLHRNFYDIYQGVIDRGFSASILGNPVSREAIEKTVAIQTPGFYQVSLEGLQENNDYIRGKNNFDNVVNFLKILDEYNIYSLVMLTLTSYNVGEVIDLIKFLDGKVDSFNFNRLSQVGEGMNLPLPDKNEYEEFLQSYLKEFDNYDHPRLKDNLFNIILQREGKDLSDGCTGFGCGAAFNFVAILPDGQVHACRKFPSEIANIFNSDLVDIYNSELARKYRNGAAECAGCNLRPLCGGCMAVTSGAGLDPFVNKDPFCFYEQKR